jgi:glycosyltransferase involved in cell wall biosynthesis
LLTGTFHSRNWILAHAGPLAASNACGRLTIVSFHEPLALPKVEWVVPSRRLGRVFGEAGARLLTFTWLAIRRRPDYLGGFHLLFNGLAAIAVAKLVGARSVYFSVGGPAEVERGGLWSENKVFQRLSAPDARIEALLLRAVGHADLVITMGSSAVEFFRHRAGARNVHVHGGGVDLSAFRTEEERDVDVLFVGRLAPIKRLDIFLDALSTACETCPDLCAVVVGDGPLRETLERRSDELGLSRHVEFAGFQENVADWLARARILVMTSDSEGLSLAVVEAMASGVVPVVRDVGDLGDLVVDGLNGYLVASGDPAVFGARLAELVQSPERVAQLSARASASVAAFDLSTAAQKWTGIFGSLEALRTGTADSQCAE